MRVTDLLRTSPGCHHQAFPLTAGGQYHRQPLCSQQEANKGKALCLLWISEHIAVSAILKASNWNSGEGGGGPHQSDQREGEI